MSGNVTITQLAKELGVSTATVSRVFNNKDPQKVSPAKREQILKLMEKYHYTPNANAAGLASGRTRMIGFQIHSIISPITNATIFDALTRLAVRNHYAIVTGTSYWQRDEESDSLNTMIKRGIDGLIWQPNKNVRELPGGKKMPIIFFNQNPGLFEPLIGTDELAGGKMAAEYLLDRKCKRICFAGVQYDMHSIPRLKGLQQVCKKNKIPLESVEVSPSTTELPDNLLNKINSETGFFCSNCRVALMLENEMFRRGNQERRNVIAYGDANITEYFLHKLPLIAPDTDALAEALFHSMMNLLDGKKIPPCQQILPLLKNIVNN